MGKFLNRRWWVGNLTISTANCGGIEANFFKKVKCPGVCWGWGGAWMFWN